MTQGGVANVCLNIFFLILRLHEFAHTYYFVQVIKELPEDEARYHMKRYFIIFYFVFLQGCIIVPIK